jgi:hypothetical protein
MTKKEMFNLIATVNADNAEIVEFCNHEIELLENRKSSKKGMTKTQKENEVIMDNIVATLESIGEAITITDLLTHGIEGFEGLTCQKVSALMRKLIESGRVTKSMEGKKALFAVA